MAETSDVRMSIPQNTNQAGPQPRVSGNRVSFQRGKGITLKHNQVMAYVHRYDLKLDTKKTESESDCERLIMKQLVLFISLGLQANDSAIIPPYLVLDRAARGIDDIARSFTGINLKGMGMAKRYFHQLFPRVEGGQFYCTVIIRLATLLIAR